MLWIEQNTHLKIRGHGEPSIEVRWLMTTGVFMRRIAFTLGLALVATVALAYGPLTTAMAAGDEGAFVALNPVRIATNRSVPPSGGLTLPVLGTGGVPAANVRAVSIVVSTPGPVSQDTFGGVLDVLTNNRQSSSGALVVQTQVPATTSLIVAPAGDGTIYFDYQDDGDGFGHTYPLTVNVDVNGYYLSATSARSGDYYHAMSPTRLAASMTLTAGQTSLVAITGRAGVPSVGVDAVALSLTGVGGTNNTGSTKITAWASGAAKPSTTNLWLPPGSKQTELVQVPVGSDGKIALTVSIGTAVVSVDLAGYYDDDPANGARFVPVSPFSGAGPIAPMDAGTVYRMNAAGLTAQGTTVPLADIGALYFTITANDYPSLPTTQTFTEWPAGESKPSPATAFLTLGSSNDIYISRQTGTSLAKTGSGGEISLSVSSGSATIQTTIRGYFEDLASTQPPPPPGGLVKPGAPRNVVATPGDTAASVSWDAPADTGSSPVLYYTLKTYRSSNNALVGTQNTAQKSANVAELTNGLAYYFKVSATGAGGAGPNSAASNSVTPSGLPGTPTSVHATAQNASSVVTWTAPDDNGSDITSYVLRAYRASDDSSVGTKTSSGSGTRYTYTGLSNGTAYYFTVAAHNVNGTGAASGHSNNVTPKSTIRCYSSDHCWGVDSVDSVQDTVSSAKSAYGNPDFVGRYINGPYAMTSSEVTYARDNNYALLLVTRGYSDESTYQQGQDYAQDAAAAAQDLGAQPNNGIAIFVDHEGSSVTITKDFIEGWFDGMQDAGYVPGYYGDGRDNNFGGSSGAYCDAVADNPSIGSKSFIWSWTPRAGRTSPSSSPSFNPNEPGCASRTIGWQYAIPSSDPNSGPNVDTDEWLPDYMDALYTP